MLCLARRNDIGNERANRAQLATGTTKRFKLQVTLILATNPRFALGLGMTLGFTYP